MRLVGRDDLETDPVDAHERAGWQAVGHRDKIPSVAAADFEYTAPIQGRRIHAIESPYRC